MVQVYNKPKVNITISSMKKKKTIFGPWWGLKPNYKTIIFFKVQIQNPSSEIWNLNEDKPTGFQPDWKIGNRKQMIFLQAYDRTVNGEI